MNEIIEYVQEQTALDSFQEKYEEANEGRLSLKKETIFAIQALNKNSYLAKIALSDKVSIIEAIMNTSLSGLTLNPVMGLAYLVPRAGRVCLDTSYMGQISMVVDGVNVMDMWAEVVYSGDEFEFNFPERRVVIHNPYHMIGNDKGDELGVYAGALLPGNIRKFEYLPIERVNSIAGRSEAYKAFKAGKAKYSIWDGPDRPEMIKKTAIRYICKLLPKNNTQQKAAQAIALFDKSLNIDFQGEREEAAREERKTAGQEAIDLAAATAGAHQKDIEAEDVEIIEETSESDLQPLNEVLQDMSIGGPPRGHKLSSDIYAMFEARDKITSAENYAKSMQDMDFSDFFSLGAYDDIMAAAE